jgi:F0F1-type ATP synthase assembly protein I
VPSVSEPSSDPSPEPRRRQAAWYRYTDAASLGIEMAAAVAICTLVARWLETNVTHWAPWTSLIGIGIGLGAATKAVVRTARNYRRELAELRDAEDRQDNDDADEHRP